MRHTHYIEFGTSEFDDYILLVAKDLRCIIGVRTVREPVRAWGHPKPGKQIICKDIRLVRLMY